MSTNNTPHGDDKKIVELLASSQQEVPTRPSMPCGHNPILQGTFQALSGKLLRETAGALQRSIIPFPTRVQENPWDQIMSSTTAQQPSPSEFELEKERKPKTTTPRFFVESSNDHRN